MERSPFFSVYILLRGTLAWSMESYFLQNTAVGFVLVLMQVE